jgi:hypothetical protein
MKLQDNLFGHGVWWMEIDQPVSTMDECIKQITETTSDLLAKQVGYIIYWSVH